MNLKVPCGGYESIILFGKKQTDKKQVRVGNYYISKTFNEVFEMLKNGVQPMLYWDDEEQDFLFLVRANKFEVVFSSLNYGMEWTDGAYTKVSYSKDGTITIDEL